MFLLPFFVREVAIYSDVEVVVCLLKVKESNVISKMPRNARQSIRLSRDEDLFGSGLTELLTRLLCMPPSIV